MRLGKLACVCYGQLLVSHRHVYPSHSLLKALLAPVRKESRPQRKKRSSSTSITTPSTATIPALIDLPTRLTNGIPLIRMDPRTIQIHTRETIPALPVLASILSSAADITLDLPIAQAIDLEAASADRTTAGEHRIRALAFGIRLDQLA